MAVGSFQVGQRFFRDEQRYRIARNLGDGIWQVEDITTGRVQEQKQTELLSQWSKGSLTFTQVAEKALPLTKVESVALDTAFSDAYKQSYTAETWNLAQGKLSFVNRLEKMPATKRLLEPLIAEVANDKKLWKNGSVFPKIPSFSAVVSWIKIYRESDRDIRSLISRHHEKGNASLRFDPKVIEIAEDAIDLIYMTPERGTVANTSDHAKGLIAKLNVGRLDSEKLLTPSYAFFKRMIGEISPYDRCRARYCQRVADIKFRAAGQGVLTQTPLARACMDHCRLDLVVLDDDSGLPLGRPWLTLIIDESTRYVLGYYIGFEEPSNVSVSRALRHALMPKFELLSHYPNIKSGWDAWAAMNLLVVDNGLEFHGETIRNGAGRFGINIQFCPRKKPWFKGKIERHFGTMNMGLLNGLPGKTFSNILEKEDYDPVKNAVIRLSTLREIVLTWVVDIYHQKKHRTLGQSPAEAWVTGIQSVDRWLPPSSLQIDSAFSKQEKRRLTHKGIEYDCLLYNSQDMRLLRESHGDNIEVEVRVMDDDLGSVIVVSPEGSQLIRVPAIDQKYAASLTRWQHAVCKRYQRRLQDDQSIVITIFEAKERIRELIRIDRQLIKRGSRKKQERFNEIYPSPHQVSNDLAESSRDTSEAVDSAIDAPSTESSAPVVPALPKLPATTQVAPPAMTSHQDDDIPELPSRRITNR